MHELPLVFFTVLGQLSAGMVFFSSLSYLFYPSLNNISKITKINIVALVFMVIGMFIASFHLGQPLRAFNVIFGIGRSPMSNEIFTFGLLFGVTVVSVLLSYFTQVDKGNKLVWIKMLCQRVNQIPKLAQMLAILLVILSVVFVWTIVLTYMLPTVKTWDTYYTTIQMYTTMLALGSIAVMSLGLYRIVSLIFVISVLLILVLKIPYLNLMMAISPQLATEQQSWLLAQCGLLVIAMVLVALNNKRITKNTNIYLIGFLCVLVGEICGRIAFYNLWTIPL
ncbi:DmsC/YnfH family molybdoenzyme membrane anchor subunit [uncultured Gilliamella sp.]|uniref:dimethyl sulfoxide reductase anchor subunit family protein n=1 Tax=uncultured Gilliamella sp. TaxID=1193505 RepID=UPI0025FE48F9|nr:DmsC/YnfH family molybdoenzyme membrane anchor subunit [uncultured Gilliamella sp.]